MNAPGSIPGSEHPAGPVPAPAQAPPRSRADLEGHFERELAELKKRLAREAVNAVRMLEESLDALWKLDRTAAGEVRRRDDTIDNEEIEIEQACLRLMALQHPFGRDFRVLAFILKVNADVERVADHATSIAKIAIRLQVDRPPDWPTALTEMRLRVPMMCHSLLRALLDEDADAARDVVASDEIIDELDKRLFDETIEWMQRHPDQPEIGIYITRAGRELERVGDLMANIAEDVVYLATGTIIRHEKRRAGPSRQP